MTAKSPSESTVPEAGRCAAQDFAAIEADLEQLMAIVNDAAGRLLGSFNEFARLESKAGRNREERKRIELAIGSAVTALQFQDLASQLTGHARDRLLALQMHLRALYGQTSEEAAREMCARLSRAQNCCGSVELF
ncbi:MAG TPA: hypothetical protein VED47_01415 [Burkholderiaceae bacterium]|nr:hypothetical protein [Burkholderiaceae bacterium]